MHRKWTRFLTLASASAATLCLGAWLSYEAAIRRDDPSESRLSQNVQAPAEPAQAVAATETPASDLRGATPSSAAVPTGATLAEEPSVSKPVAEAPASEPARDDAAISVSVASEDARSLFAEADPAAGSLELRGAPVAEVPPLLPAPGAQAAAETPAKPAPLDDLGPIPEVIPLPKFAERPVPVDGVPTPPRRPAGLAALPAAAQVASLVPVALPMGAGPQSTPGVQPAPQAAVLPQAPQPPVAAKPAAKAAAAQPAASQPAAAQPAPQSEGGFPNIANALAAVSASVGDSNGAMAPQPEAAPVFPEPTGGFKKGAQVYVRIFKREGALELWMKNGDRFALYKSYPICKWSGKLGPKLAYADYQSPEGFYSVSAKQLNPHSAYHLAFDVGYPNAYDRRHGYTGNKIMVHGDCKSVGCFAMTNAGIDEIYGFVASALASGQKEVPVHIFPFRMTEEAIARENGNSGGSILAFLDSGAPHADWSGFWHNLKEGYDLFERSHVPPTAYACGDRYEFSAAGGSCSRIAGR